MPGPSALEAAILLEELVELGGRDFALHPMAAVSGLAHLTIRSHLFTPVTWINQINV